MNYGLYLSASGVLTNLYRQDVLTNNLANVATDGFKSDVPTIRQRDPQSIESGTPPEASQRLLDRLGGGALAGPQSISFEPGVLKETGGPLDAALEGDNAFFAIADTDAKTGKQAVRLSRNGRFSRNSEGYLVQTSSGNRVLDTQDQPIRIQDGAAVTIDPSGRVQQAGSVVAQIQVASVSDTRLLFKRGKNLFAWSGSDPRKPVAGSVSVKQGYIEQSAVDPIRALMALTDAQRAVSDNARMISLHDRLMDQAVNTLGRVA
ncbi:MAG: flagellar hook-basal body protein [Planctomycetes bacterium]|nr:flagellar hook-basal body protein [Planctomycetota bacterium]